MSLFRKAGLTLCALVSALAIGCPTKISESSKKIVNESESIEFKIDGEKEITTKIMDSQSAILIYRANAGEGRANYADPFSHQYQLLLCEGGDIGSKVYVYPYGGKLFKKFKAVKLKIKELPSGKMNANDFLKQYALNNMSRVPKNGIIEADGIIEPDGVEYLEDKK